MGVLLASHDLNLYHLDQIAHHFRDGLGGAICADRIGPKTVKTFAEHFFQRFLVDNIDIKGRSAALDPDITDTVREEQSGERHTGLGQSASAVQDPVFQIRVVFRQGSGVFQAAHPLLRRQADFFAEEIYDAGNREFMQTVFVHHQPDRHAAKDGGGQFMYAFDLVGVGVFMAQAVIFQQLCKDVIREKMLGGMT